MTTETLAIEASEKPLTAREAMKLAELENRIVKDFAAFCRVGEALAEINSMRLYRTKEGRTFEQYCKELWDISKSRAYELVDASTVYNYLQLQHDAISSANGGQNSGGENTGGCRLPLNERQIRPLTKFKDYPEQVTAIWNNVLESAPNGKVTAGHVKKVVKEYIGGEIEKTVHKARQTVAESGSPELSVTFDAFSKQIEQERKCGYKNTDRLTILKMLDQLRAEIADDGDIVEDSVLHGQSSDLDKLEKAGFSLFRSDRASMTIRKRSENGGWSKFSGPFDTVKELDAEFKAILQDDKHLRG